MTIVQGPSRVSVRSAYLEQVRRIAPPELLDRDAELDELAAFCLDEHRGPYVWWRAPAWTGKSALMSTFVLRPPARLTGRARVVSFFITARLAAQDTREAFTTVLLEQLCELTGEELPIAAGEATREACLLDLLSRAAAACQAGGSRLILVVDGLDEDRGMTTGPEAHSIAALLPGHLPSGMRVIVAGRPNPPIPDDVPDWHPLRDANIVRLLGQSAHARDVERLGKSEIRRLHGGTQLEQDLLGLITAARGGLSATDLREITGADLAEIEDILHSVAGRTFTRRAGEWKPDEVYLLGHEEIHNAACRYMGPARLVDYQTRLHAWADSYREWPPETPEYLLRGYPRLLELKGGLARLTALVSEPARHDLMLALTGGDTAAITEVTTVQNLLLAAEEPDLGALAVLSARRNDLQDRNRRTPRTLPAVWARIGLPVRAGHLARGISYPDFRAEALACVGQALAETGRPEAATEFVEEAVIAVESAIPETVLSVATTIARAGMSSYAVRIIRDISDPAVRAAGLAAVAAEVPDRDQASTLCREAVESARCGEDPQSLALALITVAGTVSVLGDRRQAEALIGEGISTARKLDEYARCRALGSAAMTLVAMGDRDGGRRLTTEVEHIAGRLTDPDQRCAGFQSVISAAVEVGDVAWAERVVRDEAVEQLRDHLQGCRCRSAADAADFATAEHAASTISDHEGLFAALRYAAAAAIRAGEATCAERLTEAAEQAVRALRHWRELADVAVLVADAGDYSRARDLAIEVERLLRDTDTVVERAHERALIAEALAEVGDLDRARRLFAEVDAVVRRVTTGEFAAGHAEHLIACGLSVMGAEWALDLLAAAEVPVRGMTDPYMATMAYAILSRTCARAGGFDRARELLDASLDQARRVSPGRVSRAMTRVVPAALALGAAEEAVELARGVTHPGDRCSCLVAAARSAVRAGDAAACRELIAEAEVSLRTITSHAERAGPLANLVEALVLLGELDRAEEMAATILRPDWAAHGFSVVARARAEQGETERAERLARRITAPDSLAEALVGIAESVDDRKAARLVGEALALGEWTTALPVLLARWPDVVSVLAAAVLRDRGGGLF
ncbi:hypothetical protein GCM10010172_72130 [Paractinoplanes ferrugineus]|uniref:Nephrocystin 3-like N-terminal domain-containing protein n=1 Tax=Paractinoplanes ferrugineus TaxID=113564 RepID=A0A919J1G1_9ACTN|nr:hypothetical protein [Actinoplanes ferrugineus]GIE11632.1 hypothetical protein Afe05nite_34720 [Actinoplanes ferrugineus]